jgi:deoxyadenosine/deoxycytidine kinase
MPIIIVEGLIGAGKSTLLSALADFFKDNPHYFRGGKIKKVLCFHEPDNAFSQFKHHNPLQLFYDDPEKYAVPFQYYVIDTFSQFLKKTYKHENTNNTLYIYERSLFSCCVFIESMFENKLLSKFAYDYLLSIISRNTCDLLFKPDAIFYLDIDVSVALARINQRERVGESHCDLQQLDSLQRCYSTFLLEEKKKNISVSHCDASQNIGDILHIFLNTLSSY